MGFYWCPATRRYHPDGGDPFWAGPTVAPLAPVVVPATAPVPAAAPVTAVAPVPAVPVVLGGAALLAQLDTYELREEENMKAAYLFPNRYGQGVMDYLFGNQEPNELFSAHNGIFIYILVEELLDKGVLRIIPSSGDPNSWEDMNAWHKNNLKEYKIEISYHPYTPAKMLEALNRCLPEPNPENKTWKDLHGENREFKNDFRQPAGRIP